MSEGDPGAGDSGGGSFWTSLPALLTAAAVFLGAIVSAVVALRGGDGDEVVIPGTNTEPAKHEYFTEVRRPEGRLYIEDGKVFVKASQVARPMLVLAQVEKALADVGLSARTERVSGATDYGIGFVCRYANAANYYLLSVLSEGRYHIVRYRKGRPVSLTGGIQRSAAIEDGPNDVSARCVGRDRVELTLTVGGREVASVHDAEGIRQGAVGIRLGTSESVVTCSYTDFELKSLDG